MTEATVKRMDDEHKATLRAAEAALEQREAKVRELEGEIERVKGVLGRIEAAPEVTQADLLERENARRRLRSLNAAIASARGAVERTTAAVASAQLAADRVELRGAREAVQRDVHEVAEFVLNAERQILERLAKHRALVAERKSLETAVRVASGGSPASVAAGETPFSTISDVELWDGLGKALGWVRERERAAARQFLHAEGSATAAEATVAHEQAGEAAYERATGVGAQRAEKVQETP